MRAEQALTQYYDSLQSLTASNSPVQAPRMGFVREALAGAALGLLLMLVLASGAKSLPKGFMPAPVMSKEQYALLYGDLQRRPGEQAQREKRTWLA